MFLVFLEMLIDKEPTGGIDECVFYIIYALVPARGQRGGPRGNLRRDGYF